MKTNLKILYKTPDLEAMAEKHQDFDALMDAVTDEKIRRRKKLYRFSSFAIVIMATAFLSWLYWGYEPSSSESSEQVQPPVEVSPPALVDEEKEEQPVVQEPKEEPTEIPASEIVKEETPVSTEQSEVVAVEEKQTISEGEQEEEEMALPQVTTTRKVSMDAEPVEGPENLYLYLYKEMNLPDSLLDESNTLFFEVEFMVEKNGAITNIELSKTLPDEVDSALRVVFANMPAWKPALEANDSVASVINLPITFQKKNDN